ncbi:MAG: hypothetical protein QT10_C0001G0006 [archaeon GW2011_AR19]|nr:MAG: hypothetical protein QT10_C0001G0006 [archaeon GW2011_AR19]
MNKNNYIWIGIAVVVVIIIFIVLMNNSSTFTKKVLPEDIQISDFRYEDKDGTSLPFYIYDENEGIRTNAKITISTNRNDLYLMVYDNTHKLLFYSENPERYDGKLNVGENEIIIFNNFYLSSLSQRPELKFCVSTKAGYDYDLQDTILKDAVCKTKIFDSPEFKYEIFPNPIIITISKSSEILDDFPTQTLMIKNIGENYAPTWILITDTNPSSNVAPMYYAEKIDDNNKCDHCIKPGDTAEFKITTVIGGGLPIGTYETQGFIYGYNIEKLNTETILKQFTLKTIVNP